MTTIITNNQKTINYRGFLMPLAGLVIASCLVWSCAPLPPIETQTQVITIEEPELVKAERDSIIMVNRSFAYENWKNGDYEAACRQFSLIRKHDLEHEQNIYRLWADCYNRLGILDSARLAYEEGIEYFPDDDYLHSSLGIMYRNMGRYEDAVEHMEIAARIKTDNFDYLLNLEDVYETVGENESAIATLERMVALRPEDKGLNDRLSDLIRATRSPEEYIKTLAEQVEKFPEDADNRLDYAQALFEAGENRLAIEHFGQYIRLKPTDPVGHEGLAHALENLGRWSDALGELTKLHELNTGALETKIEIGQTYLELGNHVRARQWARKAIAVDANYGPAWLLMADIYYKSADKASGSTPKFNDKLVFAIAYGLYKKAAGTGDPMVQGDVKWAMVSLENSDLIPVKEERFMNKSKMRPKGSAYAWINRDWPEVKFLDGYLKSLD